MIRAYIAGGIAAAALAGAGVIWWQSSTIETLRDDNASLARSVGALKREAAHNRLAADVAAARAAGALQQVAEKDAKLDAIRNLDLGECADETLDPALTDLLGRRNVPRPD